MLKNATLQIGIYQCLNSVTNSIILWNRYRICVDK